MKSSRAVAIVAVDWVKVRSGVIAAYDGGYSLRRLSKKFGVSHTTLCKKLDEWGVPRRGGTVRRNLLVNDLAGKRFGRLMVVGRSGVTYPIRWIARCDCGSTRDYSTKQLRKARSCGCGPRGPKPGGSS